jgi:hypothetical protein
LVSPKTKALACEFVWIRVYCRKGRIATWPYLSITR